MTVPWSLLWILSLICSSDSSCSPTSYYKSCWIRRYPGLYVDIEESQRRGAHILKLYQEESALKCSRACCLTRNFSCNLAVFHFNTTQDSVNCFHLQCPSLESCIPHHRGNVILYNVTKGVDPDLLVFGKYFTTNVRVLPHMSSSRLNISEPLTSDKRQFNYPPNPPVRTITTPQQTTRAVPTAHQVQHTLPRCATIQATTAQSASEHVISTTSEPKMDSTLNPQQMTSTSQQASTNLRHTMGEPDTTTDSLHQRISNPQPVYITTAHPRSTTDSLTSIPINKALSFSTTQQTLGQTTRAIQTTLPLMTASEKSMQSSSFSTTLRLKTTVLQNTKSLAMASQDTIPSSSSSTTQKPLGLKTTSLQNTNSLATASEDAMQSPSSSTTQHILGIKTTTLQNTNSLAMASQDTIQSSSSSTTQNPLGLKTTALQNTNSLATDSEDAMQSSSSSTTQHPLGLKTTALQNTNSLAMASQDTIQSSSSSTTQNLLGIKTTTLQNTNSLATASEDAMQSSSSSTTQNLLGIKTTTLQSTNSLATASEDAMQSLSSSTTQQHLGFQTSTLQTSNSLASQKSMQSFNKVLTRTQTTAQATLRYTSKLEEYPKTTVQTTVINSQTYVPLQTERSTTRKPLISANSPFQTSTQITAAYKTKQAQSTSETKMGFTPNPQQATTTSKRITTDPLQTLPQTSPAYENSIWPSTQTTTLSQPKKTISSATRTLLISTTINPTITTDGSTTPRHLTLSFTHTRMGNSATTGSLSSSLTAPTSSTVDSQPYPNDTKGYISWNITTGDAPRPGGDGSLVSVWHLAANTVLVALATCAAITFCCCCSVFAALRWRGRRRRKGRYRTNLRCKRGSMRLIKYVIVRESL